MNDHKLGYPEGMRIARFHIRSLLILTSLVAATLVVFLTAGVAAGLGFLLLLAIAAAHVLAVRIGHTVSGVPVQRLSDRPGVRRPVPDQNRIGFPGEGSLRFRRRRVAFSMLAGGVGGIAVAVTSFHSPIHPMTIVAIAASGAALSGIFAVLLQGIAIFFGNLKKSF